jgi:hypothetical protein
MIDIGKAAPTRHQACSWTSGPPAVILSVWF